MKKLYIILRLHFWSVRVLHEIVKHNYFIIPIIILINFCFTCDTLLCDGTDETVSVKTYNNYYESEKIPVEYQPYRPGLQYTSEGYRYEADSRPVNYQYTSEGYRHEADGRPVDNHPYSYDSTRRVALDQMYPGNNNPNPNSNPNPNNGIYTNDNQSDSTKLGFIGGEPTNSFINREAYKAGWVSSIKPAGKHGLWECIKNDFKETRESITREKIHRDRLARLDPFYGKSRAEISVMQRAAYKTEQARKYADKGYAYRNVKVRRFD